MALMQGEAVQGDARAPQRNRLWSGIAALVLVTLAITAALWSWYQSPAALQNLPAWAQWLLKPYERNAFAQLDFVGGDIHGSFARADMLWLVGNNGLLLHSRDGGASWQSAARIDWQASADVVPAAAKKAALLPLFSPAYAEAPPSKADYGQPSKSAPSNNTNNANAPWLQKSAAVQDAKQAAVKQAPVQPSPVQQTSAKQASEKPTPAQPTPARQTPTQQQKQPQLPQQLLPDAANQAPRASTGGPVDLHAITFFDQQRGIAVGDAGVILLTQDGGTSWSARQSQTVSALNAVVYVDAITAVAAGNNGSIVVSRDGGNNWERVASGVVIDLHGITLQDNGGLIIVGAGGCILRSTDGQQWDGQWREPRPTLRAVAALQQRVMAVGDAGTVLHSTDGGVSWQSTSIAPAQLNAVLALGQGHWLAVGEGAGGAAVVWRSTDDGNRWQPQTLSGNWLSLHTASQVQGSAGVATVLAAGAGGSVLQLPLQSLLQFQGTEKPLVRGIDKAIASVVVLRDEFLAAGGDLLLHSTDGAHWNAVSVPATASINALQRVDKRVAVAVGNRGLILRTSDGGTQWQSVDGGIAVPLLTTAANGDGVVVAAGVMGTVLRSADSGKTWQVIDSGSAALDIVAAAFSSPTTAVLATNQGTVLRSIDAGLSWERLDTPPTGVIRAFAFADARNGIAVGDAGLILRTANGGKTWQAVSSEFGSTLRSALYIDSNHVLAGGDDGVLIESRDGGSSWQVFSAWQGIGAPVSALAFGDVSPFTDTSRLVVATQDGAVFSAAGSEGPLRPVTYQRYPSPLALLLLLVALMTTVPAWQRRKSGRVQESVADLLVSDRPLVAGDADYMDFSRRAAQLSRFLRHEKTELPVTLAISAEWGRGKSSLMNLMAEDLASNGFRPVWFNAWHHQKEGHLLASLLRAVQKQALPHVLTPSGFLMRVQLLSHRGAWYLIAAAFPVVLLSALVVYFSANPERLAAVGPSVRYMLNIENPVTITAQSMAKLEQAAKGEHEKMLKYWLPVLDDFRKTRHEFVDTDEMIVAMRQRQHPSAAVISSELVAQVTVAAEHLRPQTRVFPELGNVWTGLSAVFAALVGAVTMVLNGMSVFGLRRARVASADNNEKTGTRERIAADFSRLTDVLGKRLVIMIDDLDRCSRDNLLDMLEHVNFLAGEGKCAIVVAIAYDRVVSHLAVSLAEDAGRKVNDGPSETDRAEAHFYLHKLIQLMVTIRPPRRDETREMLVGRHGTPIRKRKLWKRTLVVLWRHTQPWVIILALAYVGVLAGSRGLQLLSPTPTLKMLDQRIVALQQDATTGAGPGAQQPAPAAVQATTSVRAASGFREAQKAVFPWWLLAAVAAALLLLLGGVVLYRDPQLRKQLANWLRLALAVAVREQDSSLFVRALQLWHGVIADHLQSPRALKRFLNRLRFLAMGVMSAQSDGDAIEAHVVALAALGIDNVDLEYTKLSPAQRALLDQHIAIFGRAPNEQERELYLDLVGEVDRLAMVGMV